MPKVTQLENDLNSGLSDAGALKPFIIKQRLCFLMCVSRVACVHACTGARFYHYLFFLLCLFLSSNGSFSHLPLSFLRFFPWLLSQCERTTPPSLSLVLSYKALTLALTLAWLTGTLGSGMERGKGRGERGERREGTISGTVA